MMIDMVCLKKRAEFLECSIDSFDDEKVFDALSKICPPCIEISDGRIPENNGFECFVPNKFLRNFIDLIPEQDRGFISFIYEEGNDSNIEKYLRLAMTAPAFSRFQSLVRESPNESDLYLMKYIIWHSVVLKQPVGFDFGNYEMNQIFNSLPIDISKEKISFDRKLEFYEFYRMIKFAQWGLANAN